MNSRKGAFVAGLLCGGVLVAAVWGGSVWWSLRSELSPTTLLCTINASRGGKAARLPAMPSCERTSERRLKMTQWKRN